MLNTRIAVPGEEDVIAFLGKGFEDKVQPYCLNPTQVRAYLNEWVVATDEANNIMGSFHFVSQSPDNLERNLNYLYYMKQVPLPVIFNWLTHDAIFTGQPICPGKGSLRACFNYMSHLTGEVWSVLSVVSSVSAFYQEQLGFKVTGQYTFMNTLKGGVSTFNILRWKK